LRKETGLRKLWIPLTIYVGGPGGATSRPQMSSVIRDAPEYSLKFICLAVAAKHEYLAAIFFNSKYIGCVFLCFYFVSCCCDKNWFEIFVSASLFWGQDILTIIECDLRLVWIQFGWFKKHQITTTWKWFE